MIQKTNVWKTAAGLLLTISMMISSVAMTAAAAEPGGAGGKYSKPLTTVRRHMGQSGEPASDRLTGAGADGF
ncbi:MAG: hypothetical protein ACLU3U_09250 [Gallintestinimicrobium sp.]